MKNLVLLTIFLLSGALSAISQEGQTQRNLKFYANVDLGGGISTIPTLLTPYEKQVDFVVTKYLADPKNTGEPRKELRMTVPFSTFAANFGVSFNF